MYICIRKRKKQDGNYLRKRVVFPRKRSKGTSHLHKRSFDDKYGEFKTYSGKLSLGYAI